MSWMQTYTGVKFDLMRPTPDMVVIEDIAHALSMQCRFNGHVKHFYSVAQHSVHVAAHLHHLPTRGRLQGLLHDAPEAYVGDMVRPLKNSMRIFKFVEQTVWKAICAKFDLSVPLYTDVVIADNAMLHTEARDLHAIDHLADWELPEPPSELVQRVNPLDPARAEKLFLESFRALMEEREQS